MPKTFCSVLEVFTVRFLTFFLFSLSLSDDNYDDDDDDRLFVYFLFFDCTVVEDDISRPNHHAVARDRDGHERRTRVSSHEEPAPRGDERMKRSDAR